MTLPEAIAQQPAWIGIWLNVLLAGTFIAPVFLLIWKPSRIAGIIGFAAAMLSGLGVGWMYNQMGYVKLLGLPHVILLTPVAIYFIARLRSGELPKYARWIMLFSLVVTLISLAFDYTDVFRYLLGNRTPLAMPA